MSTSSTHEPYRLGIDLGSNSIGWAALRLDADGRPCGLIDLGVRVFPDGRNPKDGSSLAAQRRAPRALRRNRDRYLRRRRNLLNALTRFGLMSESPEERRAIALLDPYLLRQEALRRPLSETELGRVLFHLNQSRGFKSNRKLDRASNEGGLIKDSAASTLAELQRTGHPTLGSWLADRHKHRSGVRVRLAGSGKTKSYPFYPLREMIEQEFDTIWVAQSNWNPRLTTEIGTTLRAIIFHQRPLKPPPVGKCWLEPGELRAPRALPTAQRVRIAQTLAHLRVIEVGMPERPLSDNERQSLREALYRGSDLTLDQVRRNLDLSPETDFNWREDKVIGCDTARRLRARKFAGAEWHRLDRAAQDLAVLAILSAESDADATTSLTGLGLSPEAAARAATAVLADGHAALSAKALDKILPQLEAGFRYSDAVQAAGYRHHSDTRTGEVRERLPYYGEILAERIGTGSGDPADPEERRLGRAPNPTVHVALNELRRLVNDIIDRFGPPEQIAVETLRDVGRSKKQREEYEKTQKRNREANDRRRACLTELKLPINPGNLMRLRLWEEQATDPKSRVCPYSGRLITARTALSSEIEEDHIIPFAVSLDDSAANRILVTREANRAKARKTPHDAFGATAEWPAILDRASLLPQEKRWRFEPNALDKFAQDGDFLARHLTDSATIARWALLYLDVICPGKVWSTRGRITSLLRRSLGLSPSNLLGTGGERKSRLDQRHHAIDAIAVALTDRSTLQRLTRAAQKADGAGSRLIADFDPPWPGAVADCRAALTRIVVSYKPDTSWQAALHNDTAYGPVRGGGKGDPNVVVRRPIETLATWSANDARGSVRDRVLAEKIATVLETSDPAARKAALAGLRHTGPGFVRRVRTVKRLDSTQPISDRQTGKVYKLVKRDHNHRAEVWRMPDGSTKLIIVPIFAAAQEAEARRLGRKPADLRPHPAAKLLMRLHKNDMLAFRRGDSRQAMRVVKMREGQLTLAPHFEGGDLKARDETAGDTFRYTYASARRLSDEGAQKLWVTPSGRVLPGSAPPP